MGTGMFSAMKRNRKRHKLKKLKKECLRCNDTSLKGSVYCKKHLIASRRRQRLYNKKKRDKWK